MSEKIKKNKIHNIAGRIVSCCLLCLNKLNKLSAYLEGKENINFVYVTERTSPPDGFIITLLAKVMRRYLYYII